MNTTFLMQGKDPYYYEDPTRKSAREVAREANRQYYGLKGLVTHTHKPCPYCGRKSCKDHQGCKAKKNKAEESRHVMIDRYFATPKP